MGNFLLALDSGSFWTFLAAAFSAVTALVGTINSFRNSKHINEVHLTFNSRMDQLLATTKQAGIAQGAATERDRRDAADAVAASTRDSNQFPPTA